MSPIARSKPWWPGAICSRGDDGDDLSLAGAGPGPAAAAMISVIIPVHDRKDLVGRAIRSVLAQTERDFELIVVDDGSADGTPECVLAEFGDDDLALLRLPECRGVSAARNHGLAAARGEWIAFLDSDDEWRPAKLEKQMAGLHSSGLFVCHTDETWIRNGVRVNPHKHHRKYGGWIFRLALPLCVMSPSSIVVHRTVFEAIGTFDEALPACEDYDFFLRLTCRYEVLYLEEELIVKYGGHDDQLSRAHHAMDRFRITALDRILRDPDAPLREEDREEATRILLKKVRIVRGGAEKRGNTELLAAMDEYTGRWRSE